MARIWTRPVTFALGQMLHVGPLQIVALSECTIAANHGKGTIFVAGRKRPVAVLIRHGKTLTAFGPEGMPMTSEHVEKLCPGAWRTALEAR